LGRVGAGQFARRDYNKNLCYNVFLYKLQETKPAPAKRNPPPPRQGAAQENRAKAAPFIDRF